MWLWINRSTKPNLKEPNMSLEELHEEADIQKLDLILSHQTLRGRFEELHKKMLELIDERKKPFSELL